MLKDAFEKSARDKGGAGLFGGFAMETAAHRETIRRRAAAGWRHVGFIPKRQRAAGFLETIDLVFERQRPET